MGSLRGLPYLTLFSTILLLFTPDVLAKTLIAHFMVGNTYGMTPETWQSEMSKAHNVGIDAFALNMGHSDPKNSEQISNAFRAAQNLGNFQLFFSFDYAALGPWPQDKVIGLLKEYSGHGAYLKKDGKPVASTFEGPGNAEDWHRIKSETNCFFIPDWSSQGPASAVGLANGVADGLFSWEPWPVSGVLKEGVDEAYTTVLGGKTYMAGVSPWFYTNMPGYGKNWMWPVKTMDLWEQRWRQILKSQPEFVQIISWNDYGESHHISSNPQPNFFSPDVIAFDYIIGTEHDGWRDQLKAWASLYKSGTVNPDAGELIAATYLLHSPDNCHDGSTPINRADHGQTEQPAASLLGGDKHIAITGMFNSEASVRVRVGGNERDVTWTSSEGGVYTGTLNIGGDTGAVEIKVLKGGNVVASVEGKEIGGCEPGGFANFNPHTVSKFF